MSLEWPQQNAVGFSRCTHSQACTRCSLVALCLSCDKWAINLIGPHCCGPPPARPVSGDLTNRRRSTTVPTDRANANRLALFANYFFSPHAINRGIGIFSRLGYVQVERLRSVNLFYFSSNWLRLGCKVDFETQSGQDYRCIYVSVCCNGTGFEQVMINVLKLEPIPFQVR